MEETQETEELKIPDQLPLLPVRDVVVFPYMILPLFVGREMSVNAVEYALANDRLIFLATQKDMNDEDPAPEAIYEVGTIAMIMRMLKLPDGRVKILVQGLAKGTITEYLETKPFYSVQVQRLVEVQEEEQSLETEALMRNAREQVSKIISLGKSISPEVLVIMENMQDPGSLADLVASNIGLKVPESQQLLEIFNAIDRLKKVTEFLNKETELLTMQQQIQSAAKEEMGKASGSITSGSSSGPFSRNWGKPTPAPKSWRISARPWKRRRCPKRWRRRR